MPDTKIFDGREILPSTDPRVAPEGILDRILGSQNADFTTQERVDKVNLFNNIGKTLSAISIGMRGGDPSKIFDEPQSQQMSPLAQIGLESMGYTLSPDGQVISKAQIRDQDKIDPVSASALSNKTGNGGSPEQIMSMIPDDELRLIPDKKGQPSIVQTRKQEKEQDIMAKVAETKMLGPVELYQSRLTEEMKQGIAQRPDNTLVQEQLIDIDNISRFTNNAELLDRNFDEISNQLGPFFSGAPIFRTIANYTDDALANSFVASVGQGFDVYRKAITGAQAGMKEISLLEKNVPSKNDRPNTFLSKSYLNAYTAENALRRQIPVLKAANTSTAFYEAALQQMTKTRETIGNILERRSPETLQAISETFDKQGIDRAEGQPRIFVDNEEDDFQGFSDWREALGAMNGK